jgi:hypothetical protein
MTDRLRIVAAAAALLLLSTAARATDGVWLAAPSGCKVLVDIDKGEAADVTVSWAGPCRDGYANGTGTVQLAYQGRPAGWYSGPVVAGKYEGKGIRSYPSGSRYEGDFRDSKRSGQGLFKSAKGWSYEGGWREDRASGTGTLIDEKGTPYTGTWLGGCLRRTPGQLRPLVGVGANSC